MLIYIDDHMDTDWKFIRSQKEILLYSSGENKIKLYTVNTTVNQEDIMKYKMIVSSTKILIVKVWTFF